MTPPFLGRHLASLNLFREPDGTVEITVAGGTGAIDELAGIEPKPDVRPIDYIEGLIVQAANRMVNRTIAKTVQALDDRKIIHVLKVHPQFWDGIRSGAKPFEVRFNDRKFRVGDHVRLMRYDPSFGVDYSERIVEARITYVLAHEDFPQGVPQGYVVLGFGQMPTFDDGK